MVHQVIEHKHWVFVEAFLLAAVILLIGFSLGYFIESYRADNIIQSYKNYEVEALDLRLQNYYFQIMNESACDSAVKQNFEFADQVYDKGLLLEKYEESSQLTTDFALEKKKYVLLKLELWMNSLILKEKCGSLFDTVVYFYQGNPSTTSLTTRSQQQVISSVLKQVKEDKGNKIILLPIAGDLDLNAVKLQRDVYNITSLPSILINEKVLFEGYADKDNIESYLR
jgi:hypothetical protein